MRSSLSTGLTLLAVGLVLAFAISPPDWTVDYVDTIDLGLVLVWTGVLHLSVTAYLHRPPRRRARRHSGLVAPRATYDARATRVMPPDGYGHRPRPIGGPDDTPTQVLPPGNPGMRLPYDPHGGY